MNIFLEPLGGTWPIVYVEYQVVSSRNAQYGFLSVDTDRELSAGIPKVRKAKMQ